MEDSRVLNRGGWHGEAEASRRLQVELVRLDPQRVAGSPQLDSFMSERLAQAVLRGVLQARQLALDHLPPLLHELDHRRELFVAVRLE